MIELVQVGALIYAGIDVSIRKLLVASVWIGAFVCAIAGLWRRRRQSDASDATFLPEGQRERQGKH